MFPPPVATRMALDDPNSDQRHYDRQRAKIRDAVDAGDLSEREGEALLAFGVSKRASASLRTAGTQLDYAMRSALIASAVGLGPLLDATEGEFSNLHDRIAGADVPERFLRYVGDGGWSDGTLRNFRNASKQYLLFVDGATEDDRAWTRTGGRDWVEHVKLGRQPKPKVDPYDLFGPDELAAIWKAIDSKRDAALFGLLYCTWQRNAVIRSFRVGDVEIYNGGVEGAVRIYDDALGRKGATGRKGLSWAVAPVNQWLEVHPTGVDDDPLICVTHDAGDAEVGSPLTKARAVNRRVRKWAERAGLERDRWDTDHGRKQRTARAHLLRYTGATRAAKSPDFSEAQVKQQGGWVQSSKQLDRYIQLTDEDVLGAWASAHGHETSAFGNEQPEFGKCGRCECPVENWLPTCPACGLGLDEAAPTTEKSLEARLGEALTYLAREEPDLAHQVIDTADVMRVDSG